MAEYHVQAPDGKTVIIQGPDGASQADILAQAQKLYKPAAPVAAPKVSEGAGSPSAFSALNPMNYLPKGALSAFINKAADAATFNFGDEVASAANAVVPIDKLAGNDVKSVWDGLTPKQAYDYNMAHEAQVAKKDATEHPVASGVGTVAGAVAGALAGGRVIGSALKGAAPAATALQRVTQGVRAVGPSAAVIPAAIGGAVAGAASGFGAGDTLASRQQSAAMGGATGAAMGGAIGGTVAGLAPVVSKYLGAIVGNAKTVTTAALGQLVKSLNRDGYDVTSAKGAAALQGELDRLGVNASLADVGPATRARAGVAMRTPSAGQNQALDTVLGRQQGSAQRLSSDIRANVAPRTDVHQLDEDIVDQRGATALPLRQQALATPVDQNAPVTPDEVQKWVDRPEVQAWLGGGGEGPAPSNVAVRPASLPVVPEDPILQKLVQLPAAKQALQGAQDMATNERALLEAQGQDTSHLPDFPADGAPMDMKSLDYLKRFLDAKVNTLYKSANSADRAEAAQVQQLRDAIRNRMRAAVPAYGQYLDTYSDASSMREALAAGRGGPAPNGRGSYPGFDRTDPEAIAAQQGKRGPAAQELYRVGVARKLEDTVRDTNTTGVAQPANKILSDPIDEQRLAAAGVEPDALQRLKNAVGRERTYGKLANEIHGSAIDARLAARSDADAGLTGTVRFNPTSPASWFAVLARKTAGAVNLAQNAKINEAIIPRILSQDPATVRRTIVELGKAGRQAEADKLARAAAARGISTTVGAAIGSPVAIREDQ